MTVADAFAVAGLVIGIISALVFIRRGFEESGD